jgi:hypothetical protein
VPYKDKAKERERSRKKYRENRESHRATCQRWLDANRDRWREYQRDYRNANREELCAYQREWNQRRKRAVVAAYGGACACCGESNIAFLTVDHIDGYKKGSGEPRAGNKLYGWLAKQDFPNGFQILCWNCNAAKGMFGACPHTVEKIAPAVTEVLTRKK